ncbi:MAG: DUF3048 domain-containing protein [Acidimicrobiia bacterium]
MIGGAVVLVVVIGGAAVALSGGSESAAPRKRRPPPPSTTTTIPIPKAPLTGLPDPSGESLTRPSLGVKIENTPEARPQTGLDVADVVYEEVVDGGVTRFWAFFNSAIPETVGPVRSVRAMDPQIVTPFGGVIAYSGGTEPNVAAIRATGLVWVDENNAGDSFFREPTRSSPHNLYARPASLLERGGTPIPVAPVFQFLDPEQDQVFTGEPIASFHLNYELGYDASYAWDAALGGWKRFQGTDEPFMAAGIPETQVAPTNVVVQFTPYAEFGEGNLFGTGEAWIFSNGQLIKGTWTRVYPGAPTVFNDAAGEPILLTPGRTWVELFPTGRTVDLVPGAPVAAAPTTVAPAP